MKLLVATTSEHKASEIQNMLAFGNFVTLLTLKDFPKIASPEETGLTFKENAELKATYYFSKFGLATLADDSGLCVDAIGGAPGIYSARYSGTQGDDVANNQALIAALKKSGLQPPFQAHYVCHLTVVGWPQTTAPLHAEGKLHGHILLQPQGTQGFGYDPLFIPKGQTCTLAELGNEEKNKISHRFHAIQNLKAELHRLKASCEFQVS